ncbi:MAG: murein biosynthesis integral membrane protein MurJ [Micromonosporaceae bacterium]
MRRGLGRAAVLIGAITVLARVAGFGRTIVFAHTVGNQSLGAAYATANQVPNIIFDIVAGGALTAVVVPVLAGPVRRADEDPVAAADVGRTASALLTWTILLLVPLSLILAFAAGPVVTLLFGNPSDPRSAERVAVATRMLVVFSPQIVLYGLAVVLYGILQSHHRFTAPALAPLVSSVVVSAAYLAFLPLGNGYQNNLRQLPRAAELMLSVGTTAGVVALVATVMVPAWRLRLRLRPALRFPRGVSRRVGGLAGAGIATLVAQDAALVAVIVLANSHGETGAIVLYNYGWQMFFLPYAVLAVPVATSAFPLLSAHAAQARPAAAEPAAEEGSAGERFDAVAATSTRAAVLVSFLGAAVLAGAAAPAARVFVKPVSAHELALAFAAFAPGLIGFGIVANLSRVLLAWGRNRAVAFTTVAGWLVVMAADLAIVPFVPRRWVVPALGLGNTIGLTVAGAALLAAVVGTRGRACVRGLPRAFAAGLAGGVAGAAAGAGVAAAAREVFGISGALTAAALTVVAGAVAAAVFLVVVYFADSGDLRAVTARVLRRRPA